MTRLRRIEDRDRFFFLTTNLRSGVATLSPSERDLVLAAVNRQQQLGEFFLFGYVVMPTHAHLLLYPHNKNLSQIMRNLKSKTGFGISKARGVKGAIWQERYFDTIIRRVRNFREKLEYIHQNPVEARLVQNPEDWKWSSYRHYARKGQPPITVDPADLSPDGDQFLWPAPWRS